MPPLNFPILKTKRLQLRNLKPTDWKAISHLRSDPEINKFVKRTTAKTKEEALAFITKIQKARENQESFYWVITPKETGQMIGSICLWNFSEDRKGAEVGYDLHPDFQGKGIMSEALKMVLDFGFKQLNLNQIDAYTQFQNKPSRNLLKRNGFVLQEGMKDDDNADNLVFRKNSPIS